MLTLKRLPRKSFFLMVASALAMSLTMRMPKPPILVQERASSPELTSTQLAEKLLKEGRPFDTTIHLLGTEATKHVSRRFGLLGRVLGSFGVKETIAYHPVDIPVETWRIHPTDVLETEDLCTRFLASDGRVFENDIDFGISEVRSYDVDAGYGY